MAHCLEEIDHPLSIEQAFDYPTDVSRTLQRMGRLAVRGLRERLAGAGSPEAARPRPLEKKHRSAE